MKREANMSTSLLPCPFCGQRPKLIHGQHGIWWSVLCRRCNITVPNSPFPTPEESVRTWNTRFQPNTKPH